MRIEFVIDELVLVGFDPRERHRIADAMESGLAALVTRVDVAPLVARGSGVSVVRAGDFAVAKCSSGTWPASVGEGASRAIAAAFRSAGAPAAGTRTVKGVRS